MSTKSTSLLRDLLLRPLLRTRRVVKALSSSYQVDREKAIAEEHEEKGEIKCKTDIKLQYFYAISPQKSVPKSVHSLLSYSFR